MSTSWEEMNDVSHTQSTVANFEKVRDFLGILSPDTISEVGNIPVWKFSEEDWAVHFTGTSAAIIYDSGNQPTVMVRGGNPQVVEYNVCHMALHVVLDRDENLVKDYEACELLPDWPNIPTTYTVGTFVRPARKLYGLIHTMPLFKMRQLNSRSEGTRNLMASYASERGAKKMILTILNGVEFDSVTGEQLRQFSTEVIDRTMEIANSSTALGSRFAQTLEAIPDADSEIAQEYVSQSPSW